MKTVNSVSGGKTSAYMAIKYPSDFNIFSLVCIDDLKSKPKDKSIIDFVNTKLEKYIPDFGEFIATAEDDKTLYVIRDLEQILGKEIIWVRGQSFDKIIDSGKQNRLPSWARRYCTDKMKLLPIVQWCFLNIGEKCKMRIGFRREEFDRMIRFFNNSEPTKYKIPISCNLYGKKRQNFKELEWRFCEMPLIKDNIFESEIINFLDKNVYVGGTLFEDFRKIDFPQISNCIGCFHKNPEIISGMAETNYNKIKWFANQEKKGMGTWLDSKITYEYLIQNRLEIAKERIFELKNNIASCDSGNCLP
jgi:hypothetical protein